jgi:hypothetical protein
MARGRYEVRMDSVAVTAAKSLVSIAAPATAILEVVRCAITTRATTSEGSQAQILRAATGGTNTASTPVLLAAYAASGATGGINHTVEPGTPTVHRSEGFNLVSGWQWVALDEEGRIVVPPSGVLAVKLNVAPGASVTMSAMIEYIEKG